MNRKILSIEECDSLMAGRTADASGLVWFDASEAPVELTGFPWFDTDHVYRRLPLNPAWKLPEAVDSLAWCTAGGKVRFKTDSTRIVVRVKLTDNNIMDHMPRTGSNGFDIYRGTPGRETYFYTTRTCGPEYDFQLFRQPRRKLDTFTINFPLYKGVREFQIGIEAGAKILPPEPLKKYVAVYGTSITQGGCASRPGMASTNILSRRLSRHFLNFGFSGSGRGEPEVAHILAELDPVMYLLDFEANACGDYIPRLPGFLRILREAHPETPILVLSEYHYSMQYADHEKVKAAHVREQQRIVDSFRKNGDGNMWSVDGRNQFGALGPEATVDGIHATDLGFQLQADFLLPRIRRILAGRD